MAELSGQSPGDVVTCPICRQKRDRNAYSQCPKDFTDLWNLDRVVAPPPPPPEPGAGEETVLEPEVAAGGGIDIFVCGRKLMIKPGQTLRLGRQDDFETADTFRQSLNVSRAHAVLRFDGGKLSVTDTKSRNGTYVNGQLLPAETEYELHPGQTLRLASNVDVDIQWPT